MPTKKILVVGGAGYIGSHMVLYLQQKGFTPIVIDNLITGHRDAVLNAELNIGDLADTSFLEKVFSRHQFAAVMHFASFIQVGESVFDPGKYYFNNVSNTLNLLKVMRKFSVDYFIFSSTAAVYGEPQYTPIDEKHPVLPVNPYGHSKKMVEQILEDFSHAYGMHFISLRYFNAAGADPSGKLRERHEPETHLIPIIMRAAKNPQYSVTVNGRDYPTHDGTCIRDFIHVNDLCEAHYLSLEKLWNENKSAIYNLGTGQGHSVQEVIDAVKQITKKEIRIVEGVRRAGDPAVLIADAKLAEKELGWVPKRSELEKIIEDVSFGN